MGRGTVIAVDVDNTIGDYTTAIRAYVRDRYGIILPNGQPATYGFDGWPFPKPFKQIHLEAVTRGRLYLTEQPIRHAVEALNDLHDNGIHIMIMTRREPANMQETIDWLTMRHIPFDGIHVGDKTLLNADYYVDDNPTDLARLAKHQPTGRLLHPNHPYCRQAPGRTYTDWLDIPRLLTLD